MAEETLQGLAAKHGKEVATHLYGQEINAETYAIAKADLLLKGEGEAADNIIGGPEYSTLSNDAFPSREFDFMLSNPPYGKSWKSDLERMGGKGGIKDPRFIIEHAGDPSTRSHPLQRRPDALPGQHALEDEARTRNSAAASPRSTTARRSSPATPARARATSAAGSSRTTGSKPSSPCRSTCSTTPASRPTSGCSTNRKPEYRKGKVQLIDATEWFKPLRKNLGKKNCEALPADIQRIWRRFSPSRRPSSRRSSPTRPFGYRKVSVAAPAAPQPCSPELVEALLVHASGDPPSPPAEIHGLFGAVVFDDFDSIRSKVEQFSIVTTGTKTLTPMVPVAAKKRLLDDKKWTRDGRSLHEIGERLADELGTEIFDNHNEFATMVTGLLVEWSVKLGAADKKALLRGLSWQDESARRVVKKMSRADKVTADALHGRFLAEVEGRAVVVEYEADSELSDFEQVPLQEQGGVATFIAREVSPFVSDAWVDEKTEDKVGFEISFTRHFYKPAALRPLEEIDADIRKLMTESDGLVQKALGGAQ